ncbi:MAG: tRNA uridine-5-carboxymethylaminomethyl(34) synthesis GTPase MnmE [Candidatus Omnitrophota bacterium]|nr:tRNA uridine-5-carboxymethylaminomethyl(34) synthesis GTPase MnmE [Candidatus Omnitrophota bacterium]MBU2528731.1 tRNA uridine-5-carboxymethylaminomethyl(34) synthesis GTPase MnmE [bacterium]MBU3929378.1 tRNA uridine-5-carboxymethylaminomethyl(34) synthesis GTPase MnmE [bacterium]MBU4122303.1 tRNA uridine-5-carboxymethylaminomethyl(34) synthesis GTPase MnmE [bacterium]
MTGAREHSAGKAKYYPDTIAAPICAWGHASVGLIRISGPCTGKILEKIFNPADHKKIKDIASHSVTYGRIHDGGEVVDEVLVFLMRSPRSYTREDVAEISSHGGPVIIKKIFKLILEHGARAAEPGEFTKRAFLNGRIDLIQAESVAGIISARGERAAKIAAAQMGGKLSRKLDELRKLLITSAAELNAAIDFPEDDIPLSLAKIKKDISRAEEESARLLDGYEAGRLFSEGVKIVIAGKPNVGKSSLINALSSSERAIVTAIPGTTRDIIRESVEIGGIPAELYDTAGLRKKPRGVIEKIGMNKTMDAINKADIIIFVFDASKKADEQDMNIIRMLEPFRKKTIMAGNKIDLGRKEQPKKMAARPVYISCLKDLGISGLKKHLARHLVSGSFISEDDTLLTSARQADCLKNCLSQIKEARGILSRRPAESVWLIEKALAELDKITGREFREEMINEIFSKFCIGK